MDSKQVVSRFEAERQALAMMDHPSIARVFDGGTTESGRPYFVMELVQGLPLTEYCDRYHLSLKERLELFVQVCLGVQHAHLKGVIHRDLKPSNIMVTLYDGGPCPQGDRFWNCQGNERPAQRCDVGDPVRPDDRDSALHESRAGRVEFAGRGYP